MVSPVITIVICTHNRAQELDRTLHNLGQAVHDWSGTQVLVIDNASTDQTRAVAERHAASLPLRVIHEPTPGLAHARNRALREITSGWLLWTDDDVDVADSWLEGYRNGIATHPGAILFGGPIHPRLDFTPDAGQRELLARYPQMFAVVDPGQMERPIESALTPYGANMMMARHWLPENAFDPALGVSGKRRGLGEETAILEAILAEGGEAWWLPPASVHHRIPASRLTLEFARRWFRGAGRAHVRLSMGSRRGTAALRMWLHLLRTASVALAQGVLPRGSRSGSQLAGCARAWRAQGMLEALSRRRASRG